MLYFPRDAPWRFQKTTSGEKGTSPALVCAQVFASLPILHSPDPTTASSSHCTVVQHGIAIAQGRDVAGREREREDVKRAGVSLLARLSPNPRANSFTPPPLLSSHRASARKVSWNKWFSTHFFIRKLAKCTYCETLTLQSKKRSTVLMLQI